MNAINTVNSLAEEKALREKRNKSLNIRLRRLVLRIKWKIARKSSDHIFHDERGLMIIVKQLLNNKESVLLMKSGMDKIYIKSNDGAVFVTVDFNNRIAFVTVDFNNRIASDINHKFGFNIPFSQRVSTYINDNFSNEVDKRRTELENEYRGNVHYSLSNVIHNLYKNEKNIDSKPVENS